MKKILLLGSTGSIGQQTLQIIADNPNLFQLTGIVCNNNLQKLEEQINLFKPKYVGINQKNISLNKKLYQGTSFFHEEAGILEMVKTLDYDLLVMAIVGAAGLKPTLAAMERGKNVALATKEVMILAGELIKRNHYQAKIFPIDSEHSAIWQSLRSGAQSEVEKIILTCSGGPFKNTPLEKFPEITVEQALNHPKWKMGKRITLDSATLMNKGLEVIEAKWLFDIASSQIEVVIHPQSILHSAVAFHDGSIIGQMGIPDMKIPIQYALTYPQRIRNNYPRLSLVDIKKLEFEKPNLKKFPCLRLAYEALKVGGSLPVVLNAADEVAVELFLKKKIVFNDIPMLIEKVMNKHQIISHPDLDEILKVDSWTRKLALNYENI